MRGFPFFLCAVLLVSSAFAQIPYIRQDSIPVTAGGVLLKNPWAGGLNFPQFSTVDLNGDGIRDLVVFDRSCTSCSKLRTFLNKGAAGQVDYVYAPAYEALFPEGLRDIVLMADYNCDGREDIFTYTSGGLKVYRNDYTLATGLRFTLVKNLILSTYYTSLLNLYVSPVNLPAFSDIDNDGDLDILTFETGGSYVEFHENLSKDLYGTCDSLVFQWDGGCWGDFDGSSNTNDVILNANCKGTHRKAQTSAHSGSTLLALDMDNDGDKELLIGCVCDNNILYLVNGGSPSSSMMVSQTNVFPPSLPVEIPVFPGTFYLDADNDGKKDLIAAPNGISSDNITGNWFYRNTGSVANPVFTFVKKGFLQDQMIETGEGCYPVFTDYDGDGLMDFVAGNYGYFRSSGSYESSLALYRNTGTVSQPAFELVSNDFAGISTLKLTGVYPAFGDLDGDGDKDMIIGEYDGVLHYFTNTAGQGQPASYTLTTPNYGAIDIGQYSTPQLVDVDRDGKLDLLIGARNGNIAYYRNTGTGTNAAFTLETSTFGGIRIKRPGYVTGYSIPFLFDSNGAYRLLVGTELGPLHMYTGIDGNLGGTFTKADTTFAGIYEGNRTSVSGADLNADGKWDFAVGNYQGGLAIYSLDIITPVQERAFDRLPVRLFPNPADKSIQVLVEEPGGSTEVTAVLYNVLGEEVKRRTGTSGFLLGTEDLQSGFYLCRVSAGARQFSAKVVVRH
jgi:hypothetical protein